MRKGFTLVELLLFAGIVAIMAGAVVSFALFSQSVGTTNEVRAEVEQNGNLVLNRIERAIQDADIIAYPPRGQTSDFLVLVRITDPNPAAPQVKETIIQAYHDYARIIETENNQTTFSYLTTSDVGVEQMHFLHYGSGIAEATDSPERPMQKAYAQGVGDCGDSFCDAGAGETCSNCPADCGACVGITVSPTSGLTTTEAGGTATFTVVLNTSPTANVTIGLSSSDTTEGTVSPASLTFTSGNWNTARTVTVTGVDDALVDGNIAYTIVTAAAVSTDSNYNNLNASDVSVTNTDNDAPSPGITVSPTSGLTTTEAGGTATFTVVLNTAPTVNVTIGLSSSDITEGTVSPASLTFTSVNWNTTQTVTVTGVDDALVDGNIAYTIVTAAAVSTDSNYDNLNASDVSVTNTDNDSPRSDGVSYVFQMFNRAKDISVPARQYVKRFRGSATQRGSACTADAECGAGNRCCGKICVAEVGGACPAGCRSVNDCAVKEPYTDPNTCRLIIPVCRSGSCSPPTLPLVDGGPSDECRWCGDGYVHPPEQCDDGCVLLIPSPFPTGCDDGVPTTPPMPGDANDNCTRQCRRAVCGDGIMNAVSGEECDDGNLVAGDDCDEGCKTETVCEQPPGHKVHVAFVVDTSSGPGQAERLPQVKAALTKFVQYMDFGSPKDKAAIISYGSTATVHQALTNSESALFTAVNNLSIGGNTNMEQGIEQARLQLAGGGGNVDVIVLFAPHPPDRKGASPVSCNWLPVAADGCEAVAEAGSARAGGMKVFTIGVAPDPDRTTLLQSIANDPDSTYFLAAPDVSGITNAYLAITDRICDCGNGVVAGGEQCDDGNDSNADACTNRCQNRICGDGHPSVGVEQCDDGNVVNGDGCSSTCIVEASRCGNGVMQGSERCDDGNTTNGDGCSSTCQPEILPYCRTNQEPCLVNDDCGEPDPVTCAVCIGGQCLAPSCLTCSACPSAQNQMSFSVNISFAFDPWNPFAPPVSYAAACAADEPTCDQFDGSPVTLDPVADRSVCGSLPNVPANGWCFATSTSTTCGVIKRRWRLYFDEVDCRWELVAGDNVALYTAPAMACTDTVNPTTFTKEGSTQFCSGWPATIAVTHVAGASTACTP